jgi:hypothetical protein
MANPSQTYPLKELQLIPANATQIIDLSRETGVAEYTMDRPLKETI